VGYSSVRSGTRANVGTFTQPVNYAPKPEGGQGWNVARWKGSWGELRRVVADEVHVRTGKQLTPEQVDDVFRTMRRATVLRRERCAHRTEDSSKPLQRVQAVQHTGTNGYIHIEVAYIEQILDKPLEIMDTLTDISYRGQTFRSTVSVAPLDGFPWILQRIEAVPCTQGEPMRCKNVHMPVDPEYLDPDLSPRSPFARFLSSFDRFEYTFNGCVDDEVMLYHLRSTGCPIIPGDEESCRPFRQMDSMIRKVEARAKMIGGNAIDAINQARAEAGELSETGEVVIDQHFPPSYPVKQYKRDALRQAMNIVDRYKGKIPIDTKLKVTDRFQNALRSSGIPVSEQDLALPLFDIAIEKYCKSEQLSNASMRAMLRKRNRSGDDSLLSSILDPNCKRLKLNQLTPTLPPPPEEPAAPSINYVREEAVDVFRMAIE
jgi:hypothetical protein